MDRSCIANIVVQFHETHSKSLYWKWLPTPFAHICEEMTEKKLPHHRVHTKVVPFRAFSFFKKIYTLRCTCKATDPNWITTDWAPNLLYVKFWMQKEPRKKQHSHEYRGW